MRPACGTLATARVCDATVPRASWSARRLVDVASAARGVVQTGLAAQALQSGLTARPARCSERSQPRVAQRRCAARRGEALAQVTQLLGQVLLQLVRRARSPRPGCGVGASLLGALRSSPSRSLTVASARSAAPVPRAAGLQVFDGRVGVVRHCVSLSFSLCVSGLALGFGVYAEVVSPGQLVLLASKDV